MNTSTTKRSKKSSKNSTTASSVSGVSRKRCYNATSARCKQKHVKMHTSNIEHDMRNDYSSKAAVCMELMKNENVLNIVMDKDKNLKI